MNWQKPQNNRLTPNIYNSTQKIETNIYAPKGRPNNMYNSSYPIRAPTNPSYNSNRNVQRRQDFSTSNSNNMVQSTTFDSNNRSHGNFNQNSFQKSQQNNTVSNTSNFNIKLLKKR